MMRIIIYYYYFFVYIYSSQRPACFLQESILPNHNRAVLSYSNPCSRVGRYMRVKRAGERPAWVYHLPIIANP